MAASPLMLEARYRSYPRALAHSLVVPTLRIGPGPSFALGQDLLSHWRVVDDPTARQVYCVLCCLPTGPFGPPSVTLMYEEARRSSPGFSLSEIGQRACSTGQPHPLGWSQHQSRPSGTAVRSCYIDEFEGRHNNRPMDTADQMSAIARQSVGKRLRYIDLIGPKHIRLDPRLRRSRGR